MKKLNIYIYSILLVLLTACQMEDFEPGWKPLGDDEMRISFVVQAPASVDYVTRASNGFQSLHLLIFDNSKEGSQTLLTKLDLSDYPIDEANKGSHVGAVTVKKKLVKNGKAILVANAKSELDDLEENKSTYSNFEDITLGKEEFTAANHIYVDINTDYKVPEKGDENTPEVFTLAQTYSQVRVEQKVSKNNFVLSGFAVHNYATQGNMTLSAKAGAERKNTELKKAGNTLTGTDGSTINYLPKGDYITHNTFPLAKATVGGDSNVLLLFEGYFEHAVEDETTGNFAASDKCYYAVALTREVKANTILNVIVTEATAKGYDRADDALANPGGLMVEFKDQEAAITDMITDGVNALAVSDTIHLKSEDTSAVITVHSRYIESPTITAEVIDRAASWVQSVGTPNTIAMTDDSADETNNKLYNYKSTIELSFQANGGAERQVTYRISLGGTNLTRDVVIVQAEPSDVNIGSIFDIKLEIYEGSALKHTISDYATFVRDGEDDSWSAGNMYGIVPSENGGRIRNQGLHMPMPNHDEDGNKVKYKYTVSLKTGVSGTATIGSNVTPTIGGVNSTSWVFEFEDGSDWSYYTYPDEFEFTTDAGMTYSLDIYHTGFFHNYGGEWYYYEVFTDQQGLHWLDRNLQAKSAGMSVRASNGAYLESTTWPVVGDRAAGDYISPVGLDSDRIPAGWRLPEFADFQRLYTESRFAADVLATSDKQQYYAPSYRFTGKEGSKSVTVRSYFPQNMMESGSAVTGESQAGYYITNTPAGAENWYTIVQFLGMNSTSQNRNLGNTSASARCVAGEVSTATAKTFSCKVKGYTHVWIYYQNNNGSITYLNKAWPGEQIAVDGDVDRYHPFSYSTYANLNGANLRVVFNKVDSDGNLLVSTGTGDGKRTGTQFKDGWFYDTSGWSETKR